MPYIIRSTFNDPTKVIDEAQVPGMGISTGMFPTRSVTISETRAGQPNTVRVDFSTTGFIPDNALIRVSVPNGLGLSLPSATQVTASTCCEAGACTTPCNISVHAMSANDITLALPGAGARMLADPNSVSFTLNNIRNLWAGNKEGFDLSLLLSDGISTVLQAKDIDGPELVPGTLRSAEAIFSETLTLSETYGPPRAGAAPLRARDPYFISLLTSSLSLPLCLLSLCVLYLCSRGMGSRGRALRHLSGATRGSWHPPRAGDSARLLPTTGATQRRDMHRRPPSP